MNSRRINVLGQELLLLPQKALFWINTSSLILSDLHLGKAGHFRKHGIPVSRNIHLADLKILEQLIIGLRPRRVLLLGDLFHSSINSEWDDFINFIQIFDKTKFMLVEGNHDILEHYPTSLAVAKELIETPFSFTHIGREDEYFNISGHIHPGVTVKGRARQSLTLSCFLFSDRQGILPAFGQFTGIKKVRLQKNETAYAIADGQIVKLI